MKLPGNQNPKFLLIQYTFLLFFNKNHLSHMQSEFFRASCLFYGNRVVSPTPLKFNDSNFKSHSYIILSGKKSRVTDTKWSQLQPSLIKFGRDKGNSSPPSSVVPMHNMMSQGHHQSTEPWEKNTVDLICLARMPDRLGEFILSP